jgi:protein SMG6
MARPQLSAPGRPSPTPKSSRDYVSASSNSSYAASISSSAFTLSSTTDESSTSSSLFDGRPNQEDRAENGIFAHQLKRLYREISNLETKVKQEDSMDDTDDVMSSRVVLKGKEVENDDFEKEKWKKQMSDHKTSVLFVVLRIFLSKTDMISSLAENIHNLLEISLSPSVPPSLRIIPVKYNIIVRLWTYAFHKLLESLRRAAFASPLALEHLQDFIYYAYIFYTGLLEDPTLVSFKSGWLEALGDLAWYRMAVAAMVNDGGKGQRKLTIKAVSEAAAESSDLKESSGETSGSAKSVSDAPAARIDDSSSPSIGLAAARLLEVEPEKERWRNIARDWYAAGIAEQPGTGKLHHHLGLLSREVEGEELRGVYHFVKRYLINFTSITVNFTPFLV